MYPRTVQENKFLPSGSQADTVRGGVTEAQENECICSGVPRGLVIERLRGHALNRKRGLKKKWGHHGASLGHKGWQGQQPPCFNQMLPPRGCCPAPPPVCLQCAKHPFCFLLRYERLGFSSMSSPTNLFDSQDPAYVTQL